MSIMHALAANLDISMHKRDLSVFVSGPVLNHEFAVFLSLAEQHRVLLHRR